MIEVSAANPHLDPTAQAAWDSLAVTEEAHPGVAPQPHVDGQLAAPTAPQHGDDDEEWEREHTARGMIRARGDYKTLMLDGVEHFVGPGGRLLEQISRSTTTFEQHVDLRTYAAGGPAIEINSRETHSNAYDSLRIAFNQRMEEMSDGPGGKYTRENSLRAVYDVVSDSMRYNLPGVKQLEAEHTAADPSRTINLATYLDAGIGICAEMGLAAGWLAADRKKHGFFFGTQTVEVNQREARQKRDAHEWMRDTPDNPDEDIYIIDPAQHVCMTLDEVYEEGIKEGGAIWNYFLDDEERDRYRQRYEARTTAAQQQIEEADLKQKRGWFRRAGKAATAQQAKFEQAAEVNPEIAKLEAALTKEFEGTSHDLEAISYSLPIDGTRKQLKGPDYNPMDPRIGYNASLADKPIATHANEDGSTLNLSQVLLVGDSAVAVITKRAADGVYDSVSFRTLPLGINQDPDFEPAVVEVKIPRSQLDTGLRAIPIGREKQKALHQVQLANDVHVSKKHTMAMIGVKRSSGPGTIGFIDEGSSNGTVVLDAKTLLESDKELLRTFGKRLRDDVDNWSGARWWN